MVETAPEWPAATKPAYAGSGESVWLESSDAPCTERGICPCGMGDVVWATWDRLPLLVGAVKRDAYRAIEAKCGELGAEVIALGGIEDHVHLLVKLPATVAVADLMKHLKGTSAHLLSQRLHPDQFFKWQGGYGAFSVSVGHLGCMAQYIAQQREHHAANTCISDWELPSSSLAASHGADEEPA